MSGLFRREKNFTSLLGEVTYNETGEAEADTRLLLTSHCTDTCCQAISWVPP